MSVGRTLRATFSPYEIAVGGLLGTSVIGLLGLFEMAHDRFGTGIICWLGAMVFNVWMEELSRCSVCTKEPSKRSKEGYGWFALYVGKRRFNSWPEKQCSECGMDLDIIPHERR